jgi:hypothetical protein
MDELHRRTSQAQEWVMPNVEVPEGTVGQSLLALLPSDDVEVERVVPVLPYPDLDEAEETAEPEMTLYYHGALTQNAAAAKLQGAPDGRFLLYRTPGAWCCSTAAGPMHP